MKPRAVHIIMFVILLPLIFTSCDESGMNPPETIQELCVVKIDGSGLKVIAQGGGHYTFLPDSNKILYTGGSAGLNGLYSINPDGSVNNQLLSSDHHIWGFSFSADNKKMLMPAMDGIYFMDLSSGSITQLLKTNDQLIRNASFSEDMTKIVYQQEDDINLMDASGNNIKTIRKAGDSTRNLSPCFILNDSQIIYLDKQKTGDYLSSLRSYSIKSDVDSILLRRDKVPFFFDYIIAFDYGKILCNIGKTGPQDSVKVIDLTNNFKTVALDGGYNFTLSYDKRKVLYLNNGGVYMINIDGTEKKLIYIDKNNAAFGQPMLSPDGQYVLFSRSRTLY